jgi:hypothetical protein
MAGLAQRSQIPAGIVVYQDCQVNLVLEILFDGLDGGGFSVQGHIQNVGSAARVEPNAVADEEIDGPRLNAIETRMLDPEILIIHGQLPR